MTMIPYHVSARLPYQWIFSQVLMRSPFIKDSVPMSFHPKRPGNVKDIAVDPVAPTTASTNANDCTFNAKP